MSRKTVRRFEMGADLWECPCGSVNIMGRKCRCGNSYGNVLDEKYNKQKTEEPKPKKARKKPYQPVKETGFLQSFFKPIKEGE